MADQSPVGVPVLSIPRAGVLLFHTVLPLRLAPTGMNEMASSLLPSAAIQIDLWSFLTRAPKAKLRRGTAERAKHKRHFGPNEEGAFIIVMRLVVCL